MCFNHSKSIEKVGAQMVLGPWPFKKMGGHVTLSSPSYAHDWTGSCELPNLTGVHKCRLKCYPDWWPLQNTNITWGTITILLQHDPLRIRLLLLSRLGHLTTCVTPHHATEGDDSAEHRLVGCVTQTGRGMINWLVRLFLGWGTGLIV